MSIETENGNLKVGEDGSLEVIGGEVSISPEVKVLRDYIRKDIFNYVISAVNGHDRKLLDETNDQEAADFLVGIKVQIREFMDKNNINNIMGR